MLGTAPEQYSTYGQAELYKKYNIGFDLEGYGQALASEQPEPLDMRGFAKDAADKLKTKFDVVVSNGQLALCENRYLKMQGGPHSPESANVLPSQDKLYAFADRFSRNAMLLKVPAREEVSLNVLFVSGVTAPPVKFFVDAGEGAKLVLNEVFASTRGEMANGLLQEVEAGIGSDIEINALHLEDDGTSSFGLLKAVAKDDAEIGINSLYAGSSMHVQQNSLSAAGKSARVVSNEVAIGIGVNKLDLYTSLVNAGEASAASADTRVVALDSSVVIAKGMARVLHGAKKAVSYIKERGLIYDRGAQIKMMPDMSIDESDVKATHSSSVAPIDEDGIFYLATRSLKRDDAKKAVVGGFMLGTIGKMKNEHARSIASVAAINKLRSRTAGVPAVDLKDAWVYQVTGSGPQFDSAYKYRR